MDVKQIQQVAKTIRRKILDISYTCNKSVHIGGALSMVDILATLYCGILKLDSKNPYFVDRDRFILSKGHGALSYYAVLLASGFITEEIFSTFQSNGSDLTAHPVMNMPLGIESSNGSLGQGLSLGVGLAIAAKARNQKHKVYVMLGDGECNEGAVWEAAMSAPNFNLNNLVAIVDKNDFQNDGAASYVMAPGDFVEKWRSFGWNAIPVDGHDVAALLESFQQENIPGKPKVLIAKTTKGKGFSFMEHKAEWHHNRLTKSQYDLAVLELEPETSC
jgi:transketolase